MLVFGKGRAGVKAIAQHQRTGNVDNAVRPGFQRINIQRNQMKQRVGNGQTGKDP